jgi:hypothetical protein
LKQIGICKEDILEATRRLIMAASAGDSNAWFEINRWVYSRLQSDERRKKPKKIELWNKQNGRCYCYYCKKKIDDIKSTHVHRIDPTRWYVEDNVALVHGNCHPKLRSSKGVASKPREAGSGPLITWSRRHIGKSYLYWWDITPSRRTSLEKAGKIVFRKKDSGQECVVDSERLLPLLTPERQTGRSNRAWGVRVLIDHPHELAIEPGPLGEGWAYLPVEWV